MDAEVKTSVTEGLTELRDAETPYEKDRASLVADLTDFTKKIDAKPPATTKPQHATRKAFDPLAL